MRQRSGHCLDPPGHEDDVELLACSQAGPDGQSVCVACSDAFGRGCMPLVERPAGVVDAGRVGCIGGADPQNSSIQTGCPGGSGTGVTATGGGTASMATMRRLNPKMRQQMGADPVALGTGELVHSVTDVGFEARGVSFAFERTYRSGGLRSGSLGPGWSHRYEERVIPVGDPFNRAGLPAYCTEALPEIRCVLRTDESGGLALWTLDPVRRTFTPPAGEIGSIAVRLAPEYAQRARDIADLPPLEGYIIEHVAAGGVRRIYDTSGVLISITDEMGFGLALTWARKSAAQTAIDGVWSNVEMETLRARPPNSLEAGNALNLLNALELV